MTRLQKQTGSLRDIQRDLKELNELRGTSIVFFLIKDKALPTDLCMTGLGMADSSRDADLYNEILTELVGVRERGQELTSTNMCDARVDDAIDASRAGIVDAATKSTCTEAVRSRRHPRVFA